MEFGYIFLYYMLEEEHAPGKINFHMSNLCLHPDLQDLAGLEDYVCARKDKSSF